VADGPAKGRVVHLEPMLREYYRVRGWDRSTGELMPEKLDALGLRK
jgi:aldehyde:ferredoxin oxidoreductase